ncbi:MAG TPA: diguanylate cyclase, partial [Gemmatimonadaceae bacterium]|nr:diguanylate cyclase [Gemmatimonadaceae bacterium]
MKTPSGVPAVDSCGAGATPLAEAGARDREIEALVEAAQLAERQGRRDEARERYSQALLRLGDRSRAPLASALLRWIGRTHQVDADYDAALRCADEALAIADACGDEGAAGHAVNLQAIIHWQQGRLDEAEQLYLRARACAQRAGERKLAAMTAQNLGVVANIRGDLHTALRHYEESLADYRVLGLAKDVCVALNNLGMLYTDMQRWDAAERAYDEALQISTALGDLSARILLEVNLAELWVAQGKHDHASACCDRAMRISEQIGDTHAHGEAHKLYGIIARERGDYPLAEEHFARAEAAATERQDLLLSAETARERAELHQRQGRNRDTLQCLTRAHRLFARLRARRDLADVDRRTTRLESEFVEVVRRWSESIESKDRYTQGHCERVAHLACLLAARLGMDEMSLFWFRIGALLHDVGKLIVPSETLNKPGKLTPEEWELLKRHPEAGVEMLADVEFPWDVLPMVRSHHEWWDGNGYPQGLRGEEIPHTARILALADVYDALTSTRSYKRALTHAEAVDVMRQRVGVQFDPGLWAHFEELMSGGPPSREPDAPTRSLSLASGGAAGAAGEPRDELTGLPLRRAFLERASSAFAAWREGGGAVALLVIDVDHFKLVNDTFGHLQGDEVLRDVASVLRREVRADDFLARYAGDEFVVLLPGTSLALALEVGERLRDAVERCRCGGRQLADGGVQVTLSIGAAAAPGHGASIEALFEAADQALYDAKRKGRNAVSAAVADAAGRSRRPHLERFVGRGPEQQRLVRLLEQAVAGEPRLVAISGEAGVGKSTLLRRLAPEVRFRSGALVTGRCHEADVRPPYGAWADIIDALRVMGFVPARPWRELPRLVPALSETPLAAAAPAEGKYALLEEIAEFLRLAAAARPLVVVLDDVQWADAATWDTLEHLLPRLHHDRILICLTIRSEDAHGIAERRRRLSRDERFHSIVLQRLTQHELAQWLEAAFQQRDFARELLPVIHRYTEGNPLLAVQVLRMLLDEGVIWHDGARWCWRPVDALSLPVAVKDLIARRLDRLSPGARRLLATCAVIGRTFDVELAVAAVEATEDELLDAIDQGLAAAVLEDADDAEGRQYAFAHVLLADAVRRAEHPRRVRRAHERVAAAMERQMPLAVAEIALHYDQAGNAARAYEFAVRAGARAVGVHAYDDATAYFRMAERHASSAEQRLQARLPLVQVAELMGRYAEGEELCDLMLEAIDGAADRERSLYVRRARERLRALQGQRPQRTLAACEAMLAEAVGAGLERERVGLLTMISQAHGRLGDLEAAERIARECVERTTLLDDDRLRAEALVRLGSTVLTERPEEAAALYERAIALFAGLDDRHGEVRCRVNMGIAHSLVGRHREAEEAFGRALELGRAAHAPDLAGLASLNLGVSQLKAGSLEEAQARFEEALSLFEVVRSEPHRLAALYNLA